MRGRPLTLLCQRHRGKGWGSAFRAEKLRLWSDGRYLERAGDRGFDLHPDGGRFALAPAAQTPSGTKQEFC